MIFGKNKKQALLNAIDDSRAVVDDFRLRASKVGVESYRTMEYRVFHKLEEEQMIPLLDEHLNKLFSGEVDSANADMLDAILFDTAREGLVDINNQHCAHTDTLRRLIIRRKADREDLRRIRDDRVDELNSMKADYEITCKMLARDYKEV